MKTLQFAFSICLLLLVSTFFGQLVDLEVELFAIHPPTDYADGTNLDGYVTYRLYAVCEHEDDFVSAVFGVGNVVTQVNTSTTFWNSAFGGPTAENISEAAISLVPSLEYDSYITIGKVFASDPGQPIFTAGTDWINQMDPGAGADGTSFTMDGDIGGSWFTVDLGPNDSPNGYAGSDLKVLIGQFTTDGLFTGCLNIQVFPNGVGDNAVETEICFSGCPASEEGPPIPGCNDVNACNFLSTATCDDGSCLYLGPCGECGGTGIAGCTDSSACNFNSDATCDPENVCCYTECGCTDPNASNYDSTATCNDGSCFYRIDGFVFNDENDNGVWDTEEYGLPNQEVNLLPTGWVAYTNDEGAFSFIGAGLGSYEVEVVPDDVFPFPTTPNPVDVEVVWDVPTEELIIGLTSVVPSYDVSVDFYSTGWGYPCNDWVNHNVSFTNGGSLPIDGIVEIEYDLLFEYYMEVTPIDSVVDNFIYMSFENLLPGETFVYNVELYTPSVDFIGQYQTSTARVYGFYGGEQVAYGEFELQMEITCAYDPNDKQVFPIGYAEPHFIQNETELEYLIRFQNTGNAPATHVLVTDTIDENLDLASFELKANSHSVTTTIKPEDRVIEFFFENIMLPDSVANEPESHGLVSFLITPYPNLDPETVLNNTGNIYFDNNPPITTNTTWNTIYECVDEMAAINVPATTACEGDSLTFSNSYPYVEEYQWYTTIEGSTDSSITLVLPGENMVILLVVSNPLCSGQEYVDFEPWLKPAVDAGEDVHICEGDTVLLTVTGDAESYLWDSEFEGESIEVSPMETTTFTVVGTSEFGCEEYDEIIVTPHAYPEADFTIDDNLLSATPGDQFQWFLNGNAIDWAFGSIYEITEDGNYSVEVTNEWGCSTMSVEQMVTYVGVSSSAVENDQLVVYPNPVSDILNINLGSEQVDLIQVFDPNGKLVYEEVSPILSIIDLDVNSWASGIYSVTMTKGQYQSTQSFLKN